MLEEVVVTARKRGDEDVQDVPLAVTAFGEDQLNALNFRDIGSVGYSIPNVALDNNGATPEFQMNLGDFLESTVREKFVLLLLAIKI
jgi:outer membrane receptor protein involved in Fe transport